MNDEPITIAVGTVPERATSLAVVLERAPNAVVYCDHERTGNSWRNVRAALARAPTDGWFIVLDDDTLPCLNFEHEARRALAACPGDIASLAWFWRPSAVSAARRAGASWIRSAYHVYGPGWAIRARLAGECLAWNLLNVKPKVQIGDQRISYWAAATGRPCFGLVPSIVEHRRDQVSVVRHQSNEGAQCCWYVEDPQRIEWNSRWVDYGGCAADFLRSHLRAGHFVV